MSGSESTNSALQAFTALLPQGSGQGQPTGFSATGPGTSGLAGVPQFPANGTGAGNSQVPEVFGQVAKNLDLLRAVTETQSTAVGANTAAVTSNTAQKGVTQALSQAGQAAGGLLGGLTALPLISGIAKLFGFGDSSTTQAAPVQKFAAPPPVRFDAVTQTTSSGQTIQDAGYDRYGNPRTNGTDLLNIPKYSALLATAPSTNTQLSNASTSPSSSAPSVSNGTDGSQRENGAGQTTQVTVNIQAMDSRSFLDRSQDIAQAVREAMLNMHSINDVVNDL